MDSLSSLLPSRQFEEPAEIRIIKAFVMDKFQAMPKVSIQAKTITITVPSGALAGALRMHLHELQELCSTDKRLVLRIG